MEHKVKMFIILAIMRMKKKTRTFSAFQFIVIKSGREELINSMASGNDADDITMPKNSAKPQNASENLIHI